jgi:hypothetical protein
MTIHIRGTVEFEKILAEPWQAAINMTRTRMTIQQLLDTHESPSVLEKRLKDYIKKTDAIIDHLAKSGSGQLTEHPVFEWSVNESIIRSPCWRLESILPRYTLATVSALSADRCIVEHNYKEARKMLLASVEMHKQCAQNLELWKWKLSTLNQDVLQKKWHLAKIEMLTGMATLCMLSTGIQKQMKSKSLFTVTQRALRNFTRSLATWPSKQAQDLMNVSEALRYYYSSDILWSSERYGESIYRLEQWLSHGLEFGPFEILKDELAKVPLLLEERHTTNNGAYFEFVKSATPLCSPVELINTLEATDIPHPPATPAHAGGGANVSTPTELPESQ